MARQTSHALLVAALLCSWSTSVARAAPASQSLGAHELDAATRQVRALLAELIATAPVNPPGAEAKPIAIAAARLREAGIPFDVYELAPGRTNLVARLRGDGSEKPLLLLAHVDVVPTAGQPWTVPAHQLTEKEGRLLGRGVMDDLGMAAAELEVLLLLKQRGTPLRRDVVVAWTAGEETGGDGIRWLMKEHPEVLSGVGLAFNEGGALQLAADGRVRRAELLVVEKNYQDFTVRAKGTAGHSSAPRADNAITRLARALERVGTRPFPPRLLPITRTGLLESAKTEEPRFAEAMRAVADSTGAPPELALAVLSERPGIVARVRTTCVATQVSGGTARNVLPAEATANLNCRVLPDERIEDVRRALAAVVDDPGIEIVPVGAAVEGRPSPLEGEGPAAVKAAMARVHPGVPVVPTIVNYYTDSRSLTAAGIPAYGIGLFPMAEADALSAHGADERMPVASLGAGLRLLHEIVLEAAARR